jgi:hypothetical protein
MLVARLVLIYFCSFCTASVASCSTLSAYAQAVLLPGTPILRLYASSLPFLSLNAESKDGLLRGRAEL